MTRGAAWRAGGSTPCNDDVVDMAARQRWYDLVGPFGASDDAIAAALADVLARYDEPHRRYHTLRHVLDVLGTLDELLVDPMSQPVAPADRQALRGAGWLHDVVYDPTRDDNETRSAAYAREVLADLGLDAATVAETSRLIELTAGHEVHGDDLNGMLLADADLAILGAAPDRYERYTEEIRAEYAHVPEDRFRIGRIAVLESFAQRSPLFHTFAASERFEQLARDNLRAELEALRGAQVPR
jgi:predicted metal-dependent HD superfamily phosphohydrolase